MVTHFLDKLLFTSLFVVALQVPILADHFIQYLSGYKDATEAKVSEYEALASQFGFTSVDALIESLKTNNDPVVRADAELKETQIARLAELNQALTLLSDGNYFERAIYMFNPSRVQTLRRVWDNFAPGIPLTPTDLIFSLISALSANFILVIPFWLFRRLTRSQQQSFST